MIQNGSTKKRIISELKSRFATAPENADKQKIYTATAYALKAQLMSYYMDSVSEHENRKNTFYLSMEFLPGRMLSNTLRNTGLFDEYKQALQELGCDINDIIDEEAEPGLGNGGLGRLGACFLDSAASLDLPVVGCGLRYENGFFKQKIKDGFQTEKADNWLSTVFPWEIKREDRKVEVRFGGHITEEWKDGRLVVKHTGYDSILAVPYDVPIIGGNNSNTAGLLKLWSAEPYGEFNYSAFNKGDYKKSLKSENEANIICRVLYPADNHTSGKILRLKQQYLLCSASIQYVINRFLSIEGSNLNDLPDYAALHINDTHPALAIPELMRILLDEHGFMWDKAWDICKRIFSYTNHTILGEAMETWPKKIMQDLLPRIYNIISEINERFCARAWDSSGGDWSIINKLSIIHNDKVRMANLCAHTCHTVNGVSQLHSEILKDTIFKDFSNLYPGKFIGITNGVTHRRWLNYSNPSLAELITEAIGDAWVSEPDRLEELVPFADDAAFREKFAKVKTQNKKRLLSFLEKHQNSSFDTDWMVDVQAKRLHEYKRQLLKALHILHLYNQIDNGLLTDMVPRTFIFAAKAAPGYDMAKLIIKLINEISVLVNSNPRVRKLINIIFLENYNVSSAEILIPATDLSEQLSTAGYEASGTGNMKFMMNGALTIGTMDGANIEIHERVGDEHFFLFGMNADEVSKKQSLGYAPTNVCVNNPVLMDAINLLTDGSLASGDKFIFNDIKNSLMLGCHGAADPYMVLGDFESYRKAQRKVDAKRKDPDCWWRSAIINTALSGFFSSDRTVTTYNKRVWHLKSFKD